MALLLFGKAHAPPIKRVNDFEAYKISKINERISGKSFACRKHKAIYSNHRNAE